jgi:hypothetical protein
VKPYVTLDYDELEGLTQFVVEASDDWKPEPPISARRISGGHYTVSGATPAELMEDPRVIFVRKPMKARLLETPEAGGIDDEN